MIHTGKDKSFSEEIDQFLQAMSKGFEFYLPDEKISSVWQETELISTLHPDFEAVYFERELESGILYLSNEYEFFPIYMMYQMINLGEPTIMKQAIFDGSDIINMDVGEEVMVVGFANPGTEDKLKKVLPPLSEEKELSVDFLSAMAMIYLDEIM